jgi:hypothetical protein
MGVARLPSAQQAWLRRHELQVGAIAVAARFAQREGAFVDMPSNGVVHRRQLGHGSLRRCGRDLFVWSRLAPTHVRREGRFLGGRELYTGAQGGHQRAAARRRCGRFARTLAYLWRARQKGTVGKFCHPRCKRCLHDSCVAIPQGILGAKRILRPPSGFVLRGKATEFG